MRASAKRKEGKKKEKKSPPLALKISFPPHLFGPLQKYDVSDTNVAGIGTDLDKAIREAAAGGWSLKCL